MFCKGGAKPKILDLFSNLQNKMHYLNDVQDLLGAKQMFVEFLVMICKGEALEFEMPKYEFSLFLGTFQSKF